MEGLAVKVLRSLSEKKYWTTRFKKFQESYTDSIRILIIPVLCIYIYGYSHLFSAEQMQMNLSGVLATKKQ